MNPLVSNQVINDRYDDSFFQSISVIPAKVFGYISNVYLSGILRSLFTFEMK